MRLMIFALLAALLGGGCLRTEHKVTTEHKVEPIHITMDVNLKVQRDLEEFLDVQ